MIEHPPHQNVNRFTGENSHLRNKGGWTSRTRDLGVQWDFQLNCGIKKKLLPVSAIKPSSPAEFEFSKLCIRKNHSYRIGELGSVCQFCGLYVPHGEYCPVKSRPSDDKIASQRERFIDSETAAHKRLCETAKDFYNRNITFKNKDIANAADVTSEQAASFIYFCGHLLHVQKHSRDTNDYRFHSIDSLPPMPESVRLALRLKSNIRRRPRITIPSDRTPSPSSRPDTFPESAPRVP